MRHLFSKLRAPVTKFTQFELYDVQFYSSFWKELASKQCNVPQDRLETLEPNTTLLENCS